MSGGLEKTPWSNPVFAQVQLSRVPNPTPPQTVRRGQLVVVCLAVAGPAERRDHGRAASAGPR